MTSSFLRLRASNVDAAAVNNPDGESLVLDAAIRADHSQKRPEEPSPRIAGGGLRCLWYGDGLAHVLTTVDEFLHTPAGTAALAEFCQARRGSRAPRRDARTLIDAVGVTAAKLRG